MTDGFLDLGRRKIRLYDEPVYSRCMIFRKEVSVLALPSDLEGLIYVKNLSFNFESITDVFKVSVLGHLI